MKRLLLLLMCTFFPTVLSAVSETPQCWMRVTLLESEPEAEGTLTDLLIFSLPHMFLKKAAWGADGDIVSFDTKYHSVLDWNALKNVKEQPTGSPGRWVDLSGIVYAPDRQQNRRQKDVRKYDACSISIGFFARSCSKHKDRRPNPKHLEAGNLERIKVKVEFASAPDEAAVFRTITETVSGGPLRLYIDPCLNDVERAFASAREVLSNRNEELQNAGGGFAPARRILITCRDSSGSFHPLMGLETFRELQKMYRLLGISSVQYLCSKFPAVWQEMIWNTETPVFIEGSRPDWLSNAPSDPNLERQSAAYARHLPVIPGKPLLVKFGDETKKLSGKALWSQGVRKQFAAYLEQCGVKPEELGLTSFDEAEIVTDPKDAVTPETRRLYYYSSQFRSEAMLDWYSAMLEAVRAAYPGKLIATGEICWENSQVFPEIFRAFEKNIFDVASHECSVLLWLMPHSAIWRIAAQRSAARYSRTLPGILYGSYRGGEKLYDIIEVDGSSALLNGMEHIYWYYDTSFRPNGFSSLSCQLKMRKINRRAARFEDLILDGESPLRNPPALLVKSYASEFWQGNSNLPHFQEFDMAAAALAWNQIPFDILSDEMSIRYRDNYKVIYLASRILPSASREPLKEWIGKGGRLVLLGSRTAVCNEFNEPASFADELNLPRGKDAVTPFGNGMIFSFAGSPGQALRESFLPADKKRPVTNVFHEFDKEKLAPYRAAFDAEPALTRPVLSSRYGVEVNFFESADHTKCAVFAVDYTSGENKKITLKLLLKGKYHAAVDENGKQYELRREGDRTVLPELELGASAVWTLE